MSNLPTVTAAVTPVALPDGFDVPGAVALARDLAMNLYDRDFILKKHALSEEQCKTLEANEYFRSLLDTMCKEWNAPRTAQERLALHTSVGLETVLPAAIARVSSNTEPLAGVAQMVKVLAEISGANAAGRGNKPATPQEKFNITINLGAATAGGGKERYEKVVPAIEVSRADDPLTADGGDLLGLPAIQGEPSET
jgi:hypothetical protein